MIPSYIPVRVAERILFVGESVQMFERDVKEAKHKPKGTTFQVIPFLYYSVRKVWTTHSMFAWNTDLYFCVDVGPSYHS